MFRRKELCCCCVMAFGLGMLFGQWMDSWFWCGGGGVLMIFVGVSLLRCR